MKKSLIKTTTAFAITLIALVANAQQANGAKGMDMGNMKMDSMNMGSSKTMTLATNEAEVKAVDRTAKTVTLNHGPIKGKGVEMPPMTMAFPVQNPSLLSGVKVGDRVHFTVENVKDQPTVTELKAQK